MDRLQLVPTPLELALAQLAREFKEKVEAQRDPPRYPPIPEDDE